MRITKMIAEEVAEKITEKHFQKTEKVKSEIKNLIKSHMESLLPDALKGDVDERLKKYVDCSDRINFRSNGEYRTVYLDEKIYIQNEMVSLTGSILDKFEKLDLRKQECQKKHRQAKKAIEDLLLNLKSYAQVKANFPEAYQYLPEANKPSVPMQTVESVRELINNI